MAVLELAAVAFEADGSGGRHGEGGFEDFAIAGAVGDAVFDFDDDLVPVLGFVLLQFFVGTGDEVVAALELGFAYEDAAVGVDGGSELELEDEIFGELGDGVDLAGEFVGLGGEVDGEDAVFGGVGSGVFGFGFAVVFLEDFARCGDLFFDFGAEAPAGEVFAVEEGDEAGLGGPVVGLEGGGGEGEEEGETFHGGGRKRWGGGGLIRGLCG